MEFHQNIMKITQENTFFRKVIVTGTYSQVTLMSIVPQGEIGMETHSDVDQILVFVEGTGRAILNGNITPIIPGDMLFISAGIKHNVENTGSEPLKLFSVYSPPEHPSEVIDKTKEDADLRTKE